MRALAEPTDADPKAERRPEDRRTWWRLPDVRRTPLSHCGLAATLSTTRTKIGARRETGARNAIRRAAEAFHAPTRGPMTSARVLSVARELAPDFTYNTLRTALTEEVADPNGRLVRLREGLLAVRESAEDEPVTRGTAHVHVLEALKGLRQQGALSATWAEVQAFLAERGMPYGPSAVQHALTQLVRDQQSPVRRVRRGSYSVIAI